MEVIVSCDCDHHYVCAYMSVGGIFIIIVCACIVVMSLVFNSCVNYGSHGNQVSVQITPVHTCSSPYSRGKEEENIKRPMNAFIVWSKTA